MFIDLPSLIITILIPLILLAGAYKPSEISNFVTLPCRKNNASTEEISEGIVFLSAMQHYLVLSGLLGFFIGLIIVFSVSEDLAWMGKAMAVNLVCPFYSILLITLICIPSKTSLKRMQLRG